MTRTASYQPPAIVERTEIDLPLVAVVASVTESAAFRRVAAYEPPAILERTEIDLPLVATVG